MIKRRKHCYLIISIVLLVLVIVVFFTHFNDTKEIDFNDNLYHEEICTYIEDNVFIQWSAANRLDIYKPFCDYYFLGADNKYIYIYAAGKDYCYENNNLSGGGECYSFVRIKYKINQGVIDFLGADVPPEGTKFAEVIKQLFPDYTRDRHKDMILSDGKTDDIMKGTLRRACNYYQVENMSD